jgi:hypothetical protein
MFGMRHCGAPEPALWGGGRGWRRRHGGGFGWGGRHGLGAVAYTNLTLPTKQ